MDALRAGSAENLPHFLFFFHFVGIFFFSGIFFGSAAFACLLLFVGQRAARRLCYQLKVRGS